MKYSDNTIDQSLIINTETFGLEFIENSDDCVGIAIKNYENHQGKHFHGEYFWIEMCYRRKDIEWN